MRFALIVAGGSGTRLWPMSRMELPKPLIPFIGGRSLLELAMERLEGLIPSPRRFVCAGQQHREAIRRKLPELGDDQFLGEPMGRDTLNAVGLGAAVIARLDPQAVFAVLTADHLIEPVAEFQHVLERGFALAESCPETLVTFGVTPTHAETNYGYLELGEPLGEGVFLVRRFREKPRSRTARRFYQAGPQCYLWNSGMFVWRASTLLDCIRRYEPACHAGLLAIADAWDRPERDSVLADIYPTLRQISIDYAVMEPASHDPAVRIVALPMSLQWLDVGSWLSFASTCPQDEKGNFLAAEKHVLLNTAGTLVVSSDPEHLIATVGCEGLIVVHTPDATLVCRADRAAALKELCQLVGERFGPDHL